MAWLESSGSFFHSTADDGFPVHDDGVWPLDERKSLDWFSFTFSSPSPALESLQEEAPMASSQPPLGSTIGDVAMSFPGTSTEREARVMRYREKKKRRKFEKKIRYASRKAYADTRPRIKGRFAKGSGERQLASSPQLSGWFS
ncbi:zinc finger protein CONSTANS-LIKE 3-like [Wolffia australiana]